MLDTTGLFDELSRPSLSTLAVAQARVITLFEGTLTSFIAADEKYLARLSSNSSRDSSGNLVEPTDADVKRWVVKPYLDWYASSRSFFGMLRAAVAPMSSSQLPTEWGALADALKAYRGTLSSGKAGHWHAGISVVDGYPIASAVWVDVDKVTGDVQDTGRGHTSEYGNVQADFEGDVNLAPAGRGLVTIKAAGGVGPYFDYRDGTNTEAGNFGKVRIAVNSLLNSVAKDTVDSLPSVYPEIIVEIAYQVRLLLVFIKEEVCPYAGITLGALGPLTVTFDELLARLTVVAG
jgi:hypothetical protein